MARTVVHRMLPLWMRAAAAAAFLIVAVLSASCGRKTDPLIPDSPRPQAVAGVQIAARDNVAFLSWSVPAKNIEGKDMDTALIAEFEVIRAPIERDRKRLRFRPVARISVADPAPAEVRNRVVYWRDTGLPYGQGFAYRIRAISADGGVGPWSDEARVMPQLALAPPAKVTALGEDSFVQLSWERTAAHTDGSAAEGFVGYNIYRRTKDRRYGDAPLNPEPRKETTFRDPTAVNDTTYFYIVRAVDHPASPWREGPDSGEASATPRDKTPPERPAGLTVVPGVHRVFLTWSENKEPDLAGYNVYRSFKSGADHVRLNDKPVLRTTYSDESVKTGATYYYIVTAVDKAGNESKPSKEQKAYAEKLR